MIENIKNKNAKKTYKTDVETIFPSIAKTIWFQLIIESEHRVFSINIIHLPHGMCHSNIFFVWIQIEILEIKSDVSFY